MGQELSMRGYNRWNLMRDVPKEQAYHSVEAEPECNSQSKTTNEISSLAGARGLDEVRQVFLEAALIERPNAICELDGSGGRYVLGGEKHRGDVGQCLVSADFNYCLEKIGNLLKGLYTCQD
jgi:hypothetical protein